MHEEYLEIIDQYSRTGDVSPLLWESLCREILADLRNKEYTLLHTQEDLDKSERDISYWKQRAIDTKISSFQKGVSLTSQEVSKFARKVGSQIILEFANNLISQVKDEDTL